MLGSVPRQEEPISEISENVFLARLRLIPGGSAALSSRIPPGTPGVYAWFRDFHVPEHVWADGERLFDTIHTWTRHGHSVERVGTIPPLYSVLLNPNSQMGPRKLRELRMRCQVPEFREKLRELLSSSQLFQSPLYVGKTSDLARRTAEHLEGRTQLRGNLHKAGIDIRCAVLVFVFLDVGVDSMSVAGDDEFEEPEMTDEDVVEELLSRLYHPRFSIRYG